MPAHLHLATAGPEARTSRRPDQPIRVVLADDHTGVRRSLRLVLDRDEDLRVVAEAADLANVSSHLSGHAPHVLVLDLRNGSSVETIRQLRAQAPQTEIVVLTMEPSPVFAQQALDAGAVGFVLKHRANDELTEAVKRAARGQEYLSPHVAAGVHALRQAVSGNGLSPRETEILRLIALGHTSVEIAAKLNLSRRTVETHRAHIHRKLALRTRAGLVQYALRNNLIG